MKLSRDAIVGVCVQKKRNPAFKQGKPYYRYLMVWMKVFKVSLNKQTPKTDADTKNLTKVEIYLKRDCDNLSGVWLTKKKGVPAPHIGSDDQALYWGGSPT